MTGQLAMTIDLIPDFIPVLGYADVAIIVAIVLRSVARQTGIDELHCHWPGTEDGFAALCLLPGFRPPKKGSCPEPDAPRVVAVDLLVRSSRVLLVPVLRSHRLIARHPTTS